MYRRRYGVIELEREQERERLSEPFVMDPRRRVIAETPPMGRRKNEREGRSA
jgi:hypothetical protein